MLVLTRKTSERILIGNDITVTVVAIQGRSVRIGIQAPGEVPVFRDEVLRARDSGTAECRTTVAIKD
jgi:carbon storage regulator